VKYGDGPYLIEEEEEEKKDEGSANFEFLLFIKRRFGALEVIVPKES